MGLSAGRTRRYTYNHLLRDLPDGGPSPGRQEELVLPLRSHSVLRQLYHRPILVSYRRHHVARDKRGGHLGLEPQVRVTRSLEPQVQTSILYIHNIFTFQESKEKLFTCYSVRKCKKTSFTRTMMCYLTGTSSHINNVCPRSG